MTLDDHPLESQTRAYEDGARRGAVYLRSLSSRKIDADLGAQAALDIPLPAEGLPAADVLELMDRMGSPGTVATATGRYFGYVIGGSLPAASGARAMLSAWDQIADVLTGPSVLAMEATAIRWVIELLDLPEEAEGSFTTGATMANMALIVTARDALLARQGHNRDKGLMGAPPLRVVASSEIHTTVLKSLRMAGLGTDRIERVEVDGEGRMRPGSLPQLDATTLVLAQAGNVCTGASDRFEEIASLCAHAGAWLHVDGAFGLWARAAKATRPALAGAQLADSWVVDSHKMLNTPYDAGLALCRHPEEMRASMAIGAAYLPPTDPSPADLAPEFSRSARGAETWAALLSLGPGGLSDMITRLHRHALHIADALTKMGFEIPHEVHLNQVFATLDGRETHCSDIVRAVQASGEAWFGAATWQGRSGFRISVCNWATTDEDVERLLNAIRRALTDC